MLLKSIKIQGMLSFRDASLEMKPLNVLIGPNASGKSNLIEIMALLQSLPRDLAGFIRRSGGINDWLWKGKEAEQTKSGEGSVEVLMNNPSGAMSLRYLLKIGERGQQFDIVEELLGDEKELPGEDSLQLYFHIANGSGELMFRRADEHDKQYEQLSPRHVAPGQSILYQRRDPTSYPEITSASVQFGAMRLYREWNLGRNSDLRRPQPTDAPNDFPEENFANLALVLNQLQLQPGIREIEQYLGRFYEMYESVHVSIQANTAQLFIREKGLSSAVPATRLSDGTLRFLCLLTILCHPKPPPLICIEEPELGLHPDIIPLIAELLKSASERTQLIVTTHSADLIDQLSDTPESVVVCERGFDYETVFKRLSKEQLDLWLEKYQLGELWMKGHIGGVRW